MRINSTLDQDIAKLESGCHISLIYEDSAEQMAASAAFVKAGLSRGEAVTYIIAQSDMSDVTAALAAIGVDVAGGAGMRGADISDGA